MSRRGSNPVERGSVTWIVRNGEILSHIGLRQELMTLGRRLPRQSVTEVAVHAWEAWG